MRKPTPSDSFNDVPPDVDGADLDGFPAGGLCWPDDPLDTVVGYVSMLDDGFFEDPGLDGLGCSPPRSLRLVDGHGDGCSMGALADMKADADLGSLAEQGAPCDADAPGRRKRSAFHVFDGKPEGLPPAQPPSLSCSTMTTLSSTASGSRGLSPTSDGTESPRERASEDDDLRWILPKKPHHRRSARRPAAWPFWPTALPLQLMWAAAYGSHRKSNASDDKDKDYELSLSDRKKNGGPRPAAAKQQRKKQGPADRTCTHCRSTGTPQWRTGPAGSGTLCNACGIRYKMGKLLPEYRPSTSPEFGSLEHSNRHRNVERIRDRKKKLKVMAPEVTPDDDDDDKALLGACKYER